jgi:ParB family transcriptional regulator, chromosome partitioning protein
MSGERLKKITDIRVGKRHRRDMGDIAGLAASIEDIGLLHPITVDEKNRLLAGARRLAACKSLGWKTVPVNVVRCT